MGSMRRFLILLPFLVVLVGCAPADPVSTPTATVEATSATPTPSSTPPAAEGGCTPLTDDELKAINEGRVVDVELLYGETVPLGVMAQGGYERIAAIRVVGEDEDGDPVRETALVAMGDGVDLMAVGELSLVFLSWGSDIDDDSPLGEYRTELLASTQAADAEDCL